MIIVDGCLTRCSDFYEFDTSNGCIWPHSEGEIQRLSLAVGAALYNMQDRRVVTAAYDDSANNKGVTWITGIQREQGVSRSRSFAVRSTPSSLS